jgi:predicted regulator of amino acid metabolism with ACT domain
VWQRARQTRLYPFRGKPNPQQILKALAQTGLTVEQFKQQLDAEIKRRRGDKKPI